MEQRSTENTTLELGRSLSPLRMKKFHWPKNFTGLSAEIRLNMATRGFSLRLIPRGIPEVFSPAILLPSVRCGSSRLSFEVEGKPLDLGAGKGVFTLLIAKNLTFQLVPALSVGFCSKILRREWIVSRACYLERSLCPGIPDDCYCIQSAVPRLIVWAFSI